MSVDCLTPSVSAASGSRQEPRPDTPLGQEKKLKAMEFARQYLSDLSEKPYKAQFLQETCQMEFNAENFNETSIQEVASQLIDRYLEKIGENPAYINHMLYVAAVVGDLEMVQFLYAQDADLQTVDADKSILYSAVENGHALIVNFLFRQRVNGVLQVNIEAGDTVTKRTPLHAAAERGNLGIANLLVAYGANRQAKDRDRKTPYDLAIENGRLALIALLKP